MKVWQVWFAIKNQFRTLLLAWFINLQRSDHMTGAIICRYWLIVPERVPFTMVVLAYGLNTAQRLLIS